RSREVVRGQCGVQLVERRDLPGARTERDRGGGAAAGGRDIQRLAAEGGGGGGETELGQGRSVAAEDEIRTRTAIQGNLTARESSRRGRAGDRVDRVGNIFDGQRAAGAHTDNEA